MINDLNGDRFDRGLLVIIIALAIFVFGVQVGIKHGKNLQKQEFVEQYGFSSTN